MYDALRFAAIGFLLLFGFNALGFDVTKSFAEVTGVHLNTTGEKSGKPESPTKPAAPDNPAEVDCE